ncbi:MAG: hypothetical protein ABW321_17085 [Polyangiales bacterium]
MASARQRWLLGVLLIGCDGAAADPGLRAWLRVDAAQFVEGPLPEPNGGPRVLSARVPHNVLAIGEQRDVLTGSLEGSATSVVIGREDDVGHWIVTASVPTVEEPGLPSYRGLLGLSRDVPPGPFALQLHAVDREGRVGLRYELDLAAQDEAARVSPTALVVELRWDNDADLDLHLQDPSGVDVFSRNINTWDPPPPGVPQADPAAWQAGGILDFDSNASCSADGRSVERITFRDGAPPGRYTVRVVAASLCGEPSAYWSVQVRQAEQTLAAASGIALPTDARTGTGARAGLVATSFVVP